MILHGRPYIRARGLLWTNDAQHELGLELGLGLELRLGLELGRIGPCAKVRVRAKARKL